MLETQICKCRCVDYQNVAQNILTKSSRNTFQNSKNYTNNFDSDNMNTHAFKYFKYKAKLSGGIVAQPALNESNGILKNAFVQLCYYKIT